MRGLIAGWRSRDPRERNVLVILGASVAAALLLAGVAAPSLEEADRSRQRLEVEQSRLARMQARADEVADLARQAARSPSADLRSALEAMAASVDAGRGERPTVTAVDARTVRVRFPAVGFDALVRALEPVLGSTGARVTEFSAAAIADAGMVRAELLVAR